MKKGKPILVFMVLTALFLSMFSFSVLAQDEGSLCSMKQFNEASVLIKQICPKELEFNSLERKHLFDDVYEYSMIFKVGKGEFDKIRLHRVVKEKAPYHPIKTEKAVMMIHGDTSSFNASFLPTSSHKTANQSLAAFLAKNNVDVWGIDLRWTFVPDNTTDFTFMKDWNTCLHLGDIETSVRFARLFRSLTNCGDGKLFLLGHSRGGYYSFAYANMETQRSERLRDIKGIISLDTMLKVAPENEALKQAAYTRYQLLKQKYDSGIYYDNEGAALKYVALMAKTAPEEMSSLIPFLTNKQVAIFLLSATYATFEPPLEPFTPYYHINAGTFDENGLPTGLQFSNLDYLMDIALNTPSYQSIGEILECEAIISGAIDLPYDDHFSEIKLPVFFVGATGGEGKYGQYVLSLLGSNDKESLIVELYPPEYAMLDYGHADLIWADNAQSLVWEPIFSWIAKH